MAIGEVLNATTQVLGSNSGIIGDVWQWGMLAIKVIGGVVAFWIIVQIITLLINWRRYRAIAKIKEDLVRIEGKLDRVLKKRK